jgi:hypothetical protein
MGIALSPEQRLKDHVPVDVMRLWEIRAPALGWLDM